MRKACVTALLIGLSGPVFAEQAPQSKAQPWTFPSWSAAMKAMPEGSVERGEKLAQEGYCYTCHGVKGVAPTYNAPSLSGQDPVFVYKALLDYKSGLLHIDHKSDVMQAVTVPMSEQDMADLAAYYAQQGRPHPTSSTKPAAPAGLAMCTGCHPANGGPGPGHTGPALGGLSVFYLKRQLHAFKDHHRVNEVGGMMGSMMQSLNDAQIEELARYYSER